MTIEANELPRLLELAARAMGYELNWEFPHECCRHNEDREPVAQGAVWMPNLYSDQCAEMNAALGHDTAFTKTHACVGKGDFWGESVHNGTTTDKLRAWREASLRAAAKVGELMEREEGK